jgi:hypothetical protein
LEEHAPDVRDLMPGTEFRSAQGQLLHKGRGRAMEPPFVLRRFTCKNATFVEWAMLGSNQRPLPCESSAIVCSTFLDCAKSLQIAAFDLLRISQLFR